MKIFKTVPSFTMPIDTTVSSGQAVVGGGHFIMEEIWKDIVGYEGYYQINKLGDVKSLPYLMKKPKTKYYVARRKEVILKQVECLGYLQVVLWKNKIQKRFYVHRLIAISFIENPENKRCVNHIDGDKKNNSLSNLEWCTHKENVNHSWNILKRYNKIIGLKGYSTKTRKFAFNTTKKL